MPNRKLCLAALFLLSTSALAQDKTLTFDNASPAKTVHLLNGTNVSIGTTGNLVAKCVLNGTACADVGGTGGGGAVPSVSLAASAFSTAADQGGAYTANTTFTLTPAVSGAQVCWRRITAGPVGSNWSGAISTRAQHRGHEHRARNREHELHVPTRLLQRGRQRQRRVLGEHECRVDESAAHGLPDCRLDPDADRIQLRPAEQPADLAADPGRPDLPEQRQRLHRPRHHGAEVLGRPRVHRFRPRQVDLGPIHHSDRQRERRPVVPGQLDSDHHAGAKGSYYLTISRCPGDFRYNIANPTEPSEGQACKNIRKLVTGGTQKLEAIRWDLSDTIQDGTTLHPTCGLAPGTTYYLNYANINPDDGIVTSEHNCPNNVSNCGVQFKSN
jgi:hypothetical protein